MKTQQRKFVIERKSGRRRSTMQPTSIWGDTDLKAIARKAESDAPHLFEPHIAPELIEQDNEPRTDPRPETFLGDSTESGDDTQISDSPIDVEQTNPSLQRDDLAISPDLHSEVKSVGRQSRNLGKRRRAVNVSRHSPYTDNTVSLQSTAAQVEAPLDDLAGLDTENRRLKGLLAKHLIEQNDQLRRMLARFGVH